jgi:DNA-binding MarR family transcriptional regulator
MTRRQDRREAAIAEVPALPCLCGNLRRAARLVSQLYESEEGWPKDLSIAQFSLLQAISRQGSITHARLGSLLGLDQTTVSRSLATLGRHRWVSVSRGWDRRERRLSLSGAGLQKLRHAESSWRRGQARLLRRYGVDAWRKLERALTRLAAAAPS